MQKKFARTIAAAAMFFSMLPAALAVQPYTLFGEASYSGGAVQLTSDASPGYAGISFSMPSGLTFAGLTTLSTDYNVTDDDCKAGSPRFQIRVDTGSGIRNIFAYIGPEPSYTGCAPNTWTNSTNLVGGTRKIDTSQLAGGTFYDTYAHALATYGSYPVLSIQLVVDSGWAFPDGEQTVLVDNVRINADTYTLTAPPTDRQQCMDGGWMTFENPSFSNQGQCIAYVESHSPVQH